MPIVETRTGRKVLKKAKQLLMLPYRYDSDLSQYVLGQTLYDLSAIIGDTISLEQQDGSTESKVNEFTDEPLVENVTSGKWEFTAQCLDLQNAVLKSLFAAYTNDTVGAAALRSDFTTIFALVVVRFQDTATPDVWMPKVQLNSRLLIQQIKTRGAQGNVSGTLYSTNVGIKSTTPPDLVAFSDTVSGDLVYTPRTPILFAPQGSSVLVLNHEDGKYAYYDMVKLNPGNQDCCDHDYIVYDNGVSYTHS